MPDKKDSGTLHHSGRQPEPVPTSPREAETTAEANGFEILLVHRENRTWERIEHAISLRNWQYHSQSNLSVLRDAQTPGVKVILVDAAYLPELDQYHYWPSPQNQDRPALFFVSDHCDIGTRIQAIHAGARKLFLEPIDLNALIKAIGDCLQPKPEPDFRVLIIAENRSRARPAVELLHNSAIDSQILTEPLSVIDSIWRFLPHLILMMDLRKNEVDNIVLTKLIREREESVAIPIVFLSADDNPAKVRQALEAGADDFLTMPVQLNQLLTTIRCRIDRTKAISAAGVHKSDRVAAGLPERSAMLQRLEQLFRQREESTWVHGLIVISIELPRADSSNGNGGDIEELVATVIDGLEPIVQENDYLARIGRSHLAILVCRCSKKDLQRLVDLAFEIVNYRLTTLARQVNGLGVGLVGVDDAQDGEALLKQGELAADSARRQGEKESDTYAATPSFHGIGVGEGAVWHKEEFLRALQSSSVNFRQRRFVCLKCRGRFAETIELVPWLEFLGSPVDVYQQAASCRASNEFDLHVCEYAVEQLCGYTQLGKPVRLIVRQSAAVLEDADYIESIKDIMRRLQIVGNGLVLEFALPEIASHIRRSIELFDELAGLGIGTCLSHFPCKKSALKALALLKAELVRPRSSMLYEKPESISWNTKKIHSQHAEVILPDITHLEKITRKWWECADYIQAEFPLPEQQQGEMREDLLSLYLGAYRGEQLTTSPPVSLVDPSGSGAPGLLGM